MKGEFCITNINKDLITGQLITPRANREVQCSVTRFPITPRLGDVFEVDTFVGNSFAVLGLLEDYKTYEVPVYATRTYTGVMTMAAKSEEDAIMEVQSRIATRTDESLRLLYPDDIDVEPNGTPEQVK